MLEPKTEKVRDFREAVNCNVGLFGKIADRMAEFGVEYESDGREPLFMCEAHSEKDVDETLNKLNDAVKYVKQVN